MYKICIPLTRFSQPILDQHILTMHVVTMPNGFKVHRALSRIEYLGWILKKVKILLFYHRFMVINLHTLMYVCIKKILAGLKTKRDFIIIIFGNMVTEKQLTDTTKITESLQHWFVQVFYADYVCSVDFRVKL